MFLRNSFARIESYAQAQYVCVYKASISNTNCSYTGTALLWVYGFAPMQSHTRSVRTVILCQTNTQHGFFYLVEYYKYYVIIISKIEIERIVIISPKTSLFNI